MSDTSELEIQTSCILKAQERNNRARIRDLRSIATVGFKEVFDSVPVLLHYNHPSLPGYLEDKNGTEIPHGILFFDLWLTDSPHIDLDSPFLEGIVEDPIVESLVLIGSSGSVGHTAHSDLDYWVCYRPEKLYGDKLALFKQKLEHISTWAKEAHGTEANFYLVDLQRLMEGKVSRNWGQEIEGEVAPLFLIEELYRTMIFVSGRLPLWLFYPVGEPKENYDELAKQLAPLNWEKDPPLYVNMGFPQKPKPQEYLAAAMWLTCKSEHDPFKGILKIVPILEALESNFTAPLLCDIVKEEIIKNTDPEIAVDPYIITVERVINFGLKTLSHEELDLLRDAAILKVLGLTGKSNGERKDNSDSNSNGADLPECDATVKAELDIAELNSTGTIKERVLSRWIKEWKWTPARLIRLLNYDNWSDRERLDQGHELLILLFSIYMRISNGLIILFPDQVNAQDEELTTFACRILGRQKGMDATVELLPSQFHRDSLSKNIAIRYDSSLDHWGIYGYSQKDSYKVEEEFWKSEKCRIYEAPRLVKIAAWLVRNQLFGEDFKITLPENDFLQITKDTFISYMDSINQNFPPLAFRSLNPESIWLVGAQGVALFFLNSEIPQDYAKLLSMDVVYRTGWGELRHQYLGLGKYKVEADKYLAVSEFLLENCGLTDSRFLVLAQQNPTNSIKRAFKNIQSALAFSLQRTYPKSVEGSLIDL
jgi:adenylate cyclase class 1